MHTWVVSNQEAAILKTLYPRSATTPMVENCKLGVSSSNNRKISSHKGFLKSTYSPPSGLWEQTVLTMKYNQHLGNFNPGSWLFIAYSFLGKLYYKWEAQGRDFGLSSWCSRNQTVYTSYQSNCEEAGGYPSITCKSFQWWTAESIPHKSIKMENHLFN